MKKLLIFALTAFFAISCGNPSAKINVTVNGLEDSTVVLCKLLFNKLSIIDTIKTDSAGSFSYKVKLAGDAPSFYYLYNDNTKLAGMVLLPGDNVTVKTDESGKYSVEGSVESENLRVIDEAYAAALAKMNRLSDQAKKTDNPTEIAKINSEASKLYLGYRKELMSQIMKNSHSITSATAFFQKFNDNLPVFSQPSDVFIFKAIHDSLATVYPTSEFLIALRDEIDRRENLMKLSNKLDNVQEQNYPDITLPDINGKEIALTSLDGKLIILSFWSVAQEEHKMFNNDLADIYKKYHDKGLEIYQVSLDVDKAVWASTVRSQGLPWISVNDGLGIYSPAAASYNLTQIPTMFVIAKNGEIIGRNVFDETELEKLVKNNL